MLCNLQIVICGQLVLFCSEEGGEGGKGGEKKLTNADFDQNVTSMQYITIHDLYAATVRMHMHAAHADSPCLTLYLCLPSLRRQRQHTQPRAVITTPVTRAVTRTTTSTSSHSGRGRVEEVGGGEVVRVGAVGRAASKGEKQKRVKLIDAVTGLSFPYTKAPITIYLVKEINFTKLNWKGSIWSWLNYLQRNTTAKVRVRTL